MSRAATIVLTVVLVAILVGAGIYGWRLVNETPARTYPPHTPLSEQCDEVPRAADRIVVTSADGTRLGAALVGPDTATTGVVLRYGASQTLCDWLPWARDVARATGAQVLVFDRRGRGSSPAEEDAEAETADTLAAAQVLRRLGIRKTVYMGSSMGNEPVFGALAELDRRPCGLISVSSVARARGGLPDKVWVVWESGDDAVAKTAESVAEAAGRRAQTLEVDTSDHSLALVTEHTEVQDFLVKAIRSCAR